MSMDSDTGFQMQNPLFLQQADGGGGGGDADAEVATTNNNDEGRRRRRPGTRGNDILQPGGVGTYSSNHGSAERGREPYGEALSAVGEGRGRAERVCGDDGGGGGGGGGRTVAASRSVTKSASHRRSRSRSRSSSSSRGEETGAGRERRRPQGGHSRSRSRSTRSHSRVHSRSSSRGEETGAAQEQWRGQARGGAPVAVGDDWEGRTSSGSRLGGPTTARGMEPPVQGCGVMTSTTFLKLVTFLGMAYFGVKLWTLHYDPASGRLCTFHDRRSCVTSALSKVFLTLSRTSAGALLPSMACCILSKCYATRYFLHHSWLALVVSFEPAHELHTYFGSLTLLLGVVHGLAHLGREFNEGHYNCFDTPMGRSGFVALVLLLPIAVPMLLGRPKKLMTFEFRKALHMLFIPFMVAMCFHGKLLAVLAGILLAWYLVDRTYFTTRMHFCIERAVFRPVGRATLVRFDLPPGYQFKVGSYIQVNCPAISAKEWHPFSMFPVPGPRPRGGFYVEAVGDWTQELFRLSLDDPCMPLWITAAQPSVLEKSIYFENVIMVCTGAGITPAICLADMLSKKKNVHLMWLSREAGMVATFEKQLRRVKSTVHLTGKPTDKTKQRLTDLLAHSKAPTGGSCSSCPGRTDLEAGLAVGGRSRNDDFDDGAYGAGGETDDLGGCSSNRRHCSSAAAATGRERLRRTPFGKPISLNFGRPDIEKFLTETIRGGSSSSQQHGEWAAAAGGPAGKIVGAAAVGGSWQPQQNASSKLRASPPPSTGRHSEEEQEYSAPSRVRTDVRKKVLTRLSTNQRISKRDLMSADLSVVPSKVSPPGVPRSGRVTAAASDMGSPDGVGGGGGGSCAAWDPRTWLVLYCGANAKVEEAVETACDDLGVTWRKEYFSAW